MDPFAAALDALFHAPGSADAIFTPKGGLPYADLIRVIRGQPDKTVPFGNGQIVEATNVFEIRASDVAEPMQGDRVTIGDTVFKLLGEALLDVEGLTWSIGADPLA